MVAKCPADNTASIEQERFWNGHWDAHKVGWLIAGCAAAVTCLLAFINICGHARNYNKPLQQRQIIRVLLLPPVYAVVSWLSYRFFRSFLYYDLAQSGYESFAIAAFLMLMLQYVGDSTDAQKAVFAKKNKKALPFPFCCWRYRPSKAYFLVLLKWSVIQYVLIGPAESITGIATEYFQVYCASSLGYQYAHVYLLGIDFVSISIALYGLIVLYGLLKEDLKGRRPLAKFISIKLVIFLVFYQGFTFDILVNRGVIKATQYWTTTNIANGLNALCICLEMVPIAAFQLWAFYWGEYHIERVVNPRGKANKKGKTNIFLSLLHALNFSDYAVELWHELRFLFDRIRGKDYTREDARYGKFDIVAAFNASDDDLKGHPAALPLQLTGANGSALEMQQSNRTEDEVPGNGDEAVVSKKALVGSAPPPAGHPRHQTAQDRHLKIDTLAIPESSGQSNRGRISPSRRSPRDSTGRYPSFIYQPGAGMSSPHNSIRPDSSARQPSPRDEHSWATPGAYTVRGFPRSSVVDPYGSDNLGSVAALPASASMPAATTTEPTPHETELHNDTSIDQSQDPMQVQYERPRSWEPQAF